MKTLAKKLMALVLCLAMALGLLGVTSAGAVQSAPKAEESASKVIYATDSKTTYVPAGYTYVYQSTDGRIYTRKATQDTYISGRTLSATEAKALASLSYGAESTITTDDGQTLVCREYDAKEAAAYSDAVKAILSGEDYSDGDKVTVVSEAHEKNDKVKVIISLEAPAVCEMDGMSVELGKGLGKAELAAVQSVKNGQSSVLSTAKKKLGHSIEVTGQFSLVTNAIAATVSYGDMETLSKLPGVKKVFIRSGIRFDYLMADPDDTFFKELVEYHVSGQLKVAPEHCAPNTLAYMGKPPIETFNKFKDKFYELSKKAGKKQYLVPYLMSSHPGSTLKDAVYLAEYLYKNHMRPEQVQDFYPTPGTVSTCMFYTGLDPYTLKPVFVEKTPEGKALQRALLQYYEPRNAEKVVKALKMTHREDLIPLLVPAAGRRAVQRSARQAEAADVTIHNDGTYTVRPNQKGHNGKHAHGQSRAAAPTGRAPSPGARFAPHSAPARKPKNDQRKENTTWKTGKKKK